ncbi:MAG TPA: branched-chain amino acid ABC transporter permease [Alphaproteobacteria bacterium]|nr:branched-chain amino acid ABC transporter permease [Alphaproteobacteria bacterium]
MRRGTIVLAVVLLGFPLVFSDPYYEQLGALVLLAAISASAWNLVGGYAGQVSVGHAVFFGIGAYMPLLVYKLWETSPLAGFPLGVAVSIGIAIVIGVPTFRLSGHYFSMATIAVAELIRILVGNWDLMGASIGLMGPATPRGWWDLIFRSSVPYYYIYLAVLAVLLALTFRMERSRFGYYLRAIRAGERASRSLGVPVSRYKLYALMLSATFTSLAGSLYAIKFGFIDPNSGLGILVSVNMLLMAALGGAGRLYGPLLGAAILVPLQTVTNSFLGGSGTGLTYILYGGIILLISRYEPGGLFELGDRLRMRRRQREVKERRHAA